MAQITIYPDIDGYVSEVAPSLSTSWADIHDGTGTNVITGGSLRQVGFKTYGVNPTFWDYIQRNIFIFDTSVIGNRKIKNATLSVYGYAKTNDYSSNWDDVAFKLFNASPAANDTIVAGDYDSCGTTAYSDAITYTSFDSSGWNTFTLNETGIAAINKSGFSAFSLRESTYDAPDITPDNDGSEDTLLISFTGYTGINVAKLVLDVTSSSFFAFF